MAFDSFKESLKKINEKDVKIITGLLLIIIPTIWGILAAFINGFPLNEINVKTGLGFMIWIILVSCGFAIVFNELKK